MGVTVLAPHGVGAGGGVAVAMAVAMAVVVAAQFNALGVNAFDFEDCGIVAREGDVGVRGRDSI